MKESDKILLIYNVLNERETSINERVKYKNLLKGSDSDRMLVDDISKIFEATGRIEKIKPEIDLESSKADFFKKLEESEDIEDKRSEGHRKKGTTRRLYPRKLMSIAAVFLVLIAAIFAFNPFFGGGNTYTAEGGVSLVKLEDGTKVWLEEGSKLIISDEYNKDYRATELIGNAYFEVSSNANKPFTIDSKGNTVEVLGTKFQVNSQNVNDFEVLVFSGKVKVGNAVDDFVFLEKTQGVRLNSKHELKTFKLENTSASNSKNSYLVFNNNSLSEVAKKLSEYFDVNIEFKCKNIDKYKGYTSTAYGGDKIDVYFEMIEKVFDVRVYQKSNGLYTIICNE